MYSYPIGLALVRSVTGDNCLNTEERKAFIRRMIRKFNERSMSSKLNPKKIGLGEDGENDVIIGESSIIITLYSQEELTTPGKAIRFLSQLLITGDPEEVNLKSLVCGQQLFKTFPVAMVSDEASDKKNVVSVDEISDVSFMQALDAYFFRTRTSLYSPQLHKQEEAIKKMKILALESNILTEEILELNR